MADFTDEEKAAKLAEGVDEPKAQDEPAAPTDDPTDQGDDSPDEEAPAPEEKPTEEEAPEATTFTKQFQNLKGDSWEEYGPELETAYQNSFGEGLKLNQQLQDKDKRIAELEAQVTQPSTTPAPTTVAPEIQQVLDRVKAREQTDMLEAFGEFAKLYPQAQEVTSNDAAFKQFEGASTGVGQAIRASTGREPGYKELFEKTAAILGWQPSGNTAQKDAALKDAASQPSTVSTTKPTPKVNLSEKELDIAKRMLGPNYKGTESELVKDLATIKSQ